MSDNASANQLKLFIERIETLEEERKGISDDIKDVYAEAKATGFDVKTIGKLIKLRAMDTASRQEADALLETYKAAIGLDSSFSPDPAEDPKVLAARAHILETFGRLGQGAGSVIQVKAALTDKAAKLLTYGQIGDHLDALVADGELTIEPGTNGLNVYRRAGS